jgi:mRNA interferase RelE/StbE
VSEDPGWQVIVTPTADRELKRLPTRGQARVRAALDALADGPTGDLKKLEGRQDEWRLRVGEWRVRFRVDFSARAFVVLHVLPRGSAYRD